MTWMRKSDEGGEREGEKGRMSKQTKSEQASEKQAKPKSATTNKKIIIYELIIPYT